MAALTAARPATKRRIGGSRCEPISYPVKASTTIYQGSLVALNAGYAVPASAATSLTAVGFARATVTGGASDGAVRISVQPGIANWDLKSGDAPTQANAGAVVYMEDDHTVRLTSTGSSVAGVLVGIDPDDSTQGLVLTGQGLNA